MLTLDFPVPEIIHICKDQFVLGGYFFLMEHLQGKNLNDYITQHYHTIANIPRILAQTQLRLHQLDTDFVMNLLKEQGIDITSYTFEGILETVKTKTYALSSDHLEAKFDWLNTNQPETFEKTVICHSDLHFGNILYDDNGVTGVLDWGKTRFCEREYDIAATLLLLEMIHRHYTFSPQFIIRTLRGYLIWMYLSEYRNHQRIDTEKIQYYKALIAYQEMMTIHASSKRDAWYQQTLEFYLDQFETSTQFF
jgi:aminoglycoside phosphotransferase (APT) family kinase protein